MQKVYVIYFKVGHSRQLMAAMCPICELVPFLLDEAGSKAIPKELPLHSLGFICYKYLALCTAQGAGTQWPHGRSYEQRLLMGAGVYTYVRTYVCIHFFQ